MIIKISCQIPNTEINSIFNNKKLITRLYFDINPITGFLLMLLISISMLYADAGAFMRKGNNLMRKGKYEDALKSYEQAQVLEPDNIKIHYNMGRALYKMERYPEATREFELGLLTKDKKFQANSFYNIGNCKFKQGDIDGAINAYKTALLLNGKDRQAKENLEFCLKLKEQLKNQPRSDSTPQQNQQQQLQPQNQTQMQVPGMSKSDANRVLELLKNKEKEERKKERPKPQLEKVEKDW
ncbi:MAG: tetratricopeptide repeat protein [candidate division WOR-3 bacterium]|nr:tetratricopeptide repeat protein [candidate division WOR-3 bacterium]